MSRVDPARPGAVPVALTPWGPDEWAVVVRPGSDSLHLYQAVAELPAGLEFVEAFGDVEITLIYRTRALTLLDTGTTEPDEVTAGGRR